MSKATLPSLDAPVWSRLLLTGLLPLILLAVYWEGLDYDPGLIQLNRDKGQAAALPLPTKLAGLPRFGQVRQYNDDNLYEYINGHAEYYLSSGFRSLHVVEYAVEGEQQPQLVINLYHMSKPLFAFGALMDELAPGAKPVELGSMAFAVEKGVNLIYGPYYVQLSSFRDGLDLNKAGSAITQALQKTLGKVEVLNLAFPDLGETVETYFVKEDFRGMEFLDLVLERTFRRGNEKVSAFLINGTAEKIASIRRALLDFLKQDGIPFEEKHSGELVYHEVNDPYEGRWFFTAGETRLLGVFAEPTPEILRSIVATAAEKEISATD